VRELRGPRDLGRWARPIREHEPHTHKELRGGGREEVDDLETEVASELEPIADQGGPHAAAPSIRGDHNGSEKARWAIDLQASATDDSVVIFLRSGHDEPFRALICEACERKAAARQQATDGVEIPGHRGAEVYGFHLFSSTMMRKRSRLETPAK
jgi:hypothetical protein